MINNNRQQNGRRRGRGGQRQGGNQGNGSRIDNRARGNAAQLLEKYKSLAADAQRQGDRVNTEYYLQFADHYFRVVSEQRGRFEEQDRQRQGGQGSFDDDDFDGDEGEAREGHAQRDGNRETNRDGARDQNRDGQREYNRDGRDGGRDGNRESRDNGAREPRRERFQRDRDEGPAEGVPATEGEPVAAAEQQDRPRRARAPRREETAPADTFDAALLPPSFAPANDGDVAEAEPDAKPRRRRLRPAGEANAG